MRSLIRQVAGGLRRVTAQYSPTKNGDRGSGELFFFNSERLQARAHELAATFAEAKPYPHVVIEDFLPREAAIRAARLFPLPDAPCWLDWRVRDPVHQPLKLGVGDAARLDGVDPWLRHLLNEFNSAAVIRFLETLTGISGLIPDPYLSGGGLHQILPGGKLAVHSDFNYHGTLRLYRRLNVLLYLNPEWQEAWGGELELWSAATKTCEVKVQPILNRCVIFATDRSSLHGHPKPLSCPEGISRKSLAFYYYTVTPWPQQSEPVETEWLESAQNEVG